MPLDFPRVLDLVMRPKQMMPFRQRIGTAVAGRVLDLAIGSGSTGHTQVRFLAWTFPKSFCASPRNEARYFPVGDTKMLVRLVQWLKRESRFPARLGKALAGVRSCSGRRETASWHRLLAGFGRQHSAEQRESGRLTGRVGPGKV